jgi:hypothetical protein
MRLGLLCAIGIRCTVIGFFEKLIFIKVPLSILPIYPCCDTQNKPSVPFLGMYLMDLGDLEDLPNYLVDNPGMINVDKFRKFDAIVCRIKNHQELEFNIVKNDELAALLLDLQYVPDPEAMSLSMRREIMRTEVVPAPHSQVQHHNKTQSYSGDDML